MPLITPKSGESEKEFISRFMDNTAMFSEYPDQKQRLAIAYSQYKHKSKKHDFSNILKTDYYSVAKNWKKWDAEHFKGKSSKDVALEAAQISRREHPATIDPRVDRTYAQENYLQDLARLHPNQAKDIAGKMREDPVSHSEHAGVSPEMIGRYASIIERRLKLFPPK